ncbi:MAG: hypothetical protein IKH27_14465 [Oscillospiraceae bacterium]|nr:hypothetical protein [Oscillospiraceae bacterium]
MDENRSELSTGLPELTEEQKKNPVSSGAVQWTDPLDKPEQTQQQTGKLAMASVLLGGAGLCMICAVPAAAILGTAGLICGILSGSRHENAKTLRIIGITLSSCALAAALVVFIMHAALLIGSENAGSYYQDIENEIGI